MRATLTYLPKSAQSERTAGVTQPVLPSLGGLKMVTIHNISGLGCTAKISEEWEQKLNQALEDKGGKLTLNQW